MTSDPSPSDLDELEQRLRQARQTAGLDPSSRPVAGEGTSSGTSSGSDMATGLRMSVELVAGVVVGVLLGLGIDRWLGTKPWGLVAMAFVGAVAGFMNIYRIANGYGYAAGFKRSGDGRDQQG
jgi:ATP synthase protein I